MDRLSNIAGDSLEETEGCLLPLLPLSQFWTAVTTLLIVKIGVCVSHGLQPPPLKVIVHRLPVIGVILLELFLLFHPTVVSPLDVPEDVVLFREPTEGACSMTVPDTSTRPRTSAIRIHSTHPAIRTTNHR